MVYEPYKRAMENNQSVYFETQSQARNARTASRGLLSGAQWHPLDSANRSSLERPSRTVSPQKSMPSAVPGLQFLPAEKLLCVFERIFYRPAVRQTTHHLGRFHGYISRKKKSSFFCLVDRG